MDKKWEHAETLLIWVPEYLKFYRISRSDNTEGGFDSCLEYDSAQYSDPCSSGTMFGKYDSGAVSYDSASVNSWLEIIPSVIRIDLGDRNAVFTVNVLGETD